MAEKKKGGNTVSAVWDLAEPLAQELGLILWDVKFVKEGPCYYLRIIIDKEGGISIDDCVNMSHAIDAPLDELDPIEQSYSLQVQSPGLERELVRDSHFERFIGAKILARLQRAVDGKKEFKGSLQAYKDGAVTLRLEDGQLLEFNKKEASKIRLDDFDDFN